MRIEEKLNFTEEQRSYVESIVKSRPMSRVACIRYLMRLVKSSEAEDEDDAYELKELGKRTARTLCKMTDEEYAEFVYNRMEGQIKK